MLKNPNNIAKGIIHQTSIFVTGAKRVNCQKLKIIIGRVVVKADKVKTKLSLIAKKLGKKKNIFSQNFWKYKSPKTAKKLK